MLMNQRMHLAGYPDSSNRYSTWAYRNTALQRITHVTAHVLWKIQQKDELFCISSLEEPKVKHTLALS